MKTVWWLQVCCVILALVGCSSMESEWRATQEADLPNAYHSFLARYPNSPQRVIAERRVKEFANRAYEEATVRDTLDAYKKFMKAYPGDERIELVHSRMAEIAWRDARAVNSVVSIRTFLEDHPASQHSDEAREVLKELKGEALRSPLWDSGGVPEGCSWACSGSECSLDDVDQDIVTVTNEYYKHVEGHGGDMKLKRGNEFFRGIEYYCEVSNKVRPSVKRLASCTAKGVHRYLIWSETDIEADKLLITNVRITSKSAGWRKECY